MVDIVIGLHFSMSKGFINSGFMNEEEAPVSIKNFSCLPNGEFMFI